MKPAGTLRHFLFTFLGVSVKAFVRGNATFAVVLFLFSSSGTWKYFASSVAAYDLQQVTQWAQPPERNRQPVVIAIDDEGYQAFFGAKSPLSRDRVREFLEVVDQHTPSAKRITLDIDLSPVAGDSDAQARLDALFLKRPGKWVLPAVQSKAVGNPAEVRQWRQRLCARGVGFGLSYLPTEFGYPRLTHQYEGSLADATMRPGVGCVDPDRDPVQKPMPLHADALQSGLVVPFKGDLEALKQTLDMLQPEMVVVGGVWGHTDILGTPFGDRYGVQIHAAAVAGAMSHERLAPLFVEVLLTWGFLTLIWVTLLYVGRAFDRVAVSPAPSMVGHVFFAKTGKPLLMTLTVLCVMAATITLLTLVHAETGLWINAAQVCSGGILYFAVQWNFGRTEMDHFDGWASIWDKLLVREALADVRSIRQAWRGLFLARPAWREGDGQIPVGRARIALELASASVSLSAQTIVPLISMTYIVIKCLK